MDRAGFKTRVLLSFLLLSLPLLIGVSAVSYWTLLGSARKNAVLESRKRLTIASVYLELLLRDAENLSRFILYDDSVQDFLAGRGEGADAPRAAVSAWMHSALSYRDYIDSVVLAAGSEVVFSTDSALSDIASGGNLARKWWYSGYDPSRTAYRWVANARSEGGSGAWGNDLMLIRRVTSKRDFVTRLGVLMIFLKSRHLEDLLRSLRIGETGRFAVFDGSGAPALRQDAPGTPVGLIDSAWPSMGSGSPPEEARFERVGRSVYLVCRTGFPKMDWTIASAVPFSEVSSDFEWMARQMQVMILAFVLVSIAVSYLVASSISRPIKSLSIMMDEFEGDPGRRAEAPEAQGYRRRGDEVGRMYRSFESLVSRITSLIRENYVKDIERRKAELSALESQINPHFLYNTLDSINWLALANGQRRISDMVIALSDTFRMSLHKTDSFFVPLEDELRHARSYLVIQGYRYGDRLSVGFDVDEGVERAWVLRFILQPLIENAIEHGIGRLDGHGAIDVRARESNGSLIVEIRNDGEPPDLARIARILTGGARGERASEPAPESAYYGISNIDGRIKLTHGDRYGLSYRAENGRTLCQVDLPLLREPPADRA